MIDIYASQLLTAALTGNLSDVKKLVEMGTDINSKFDLGFTPVHVASKNGHLFVVEYLVQNGASINEINNNGVTALHWACGMGYLEIAYYLIDQGADINCTDNNNVSALHWASSKGNNLVVKFLLDNGANVDQQDSSGFTPLHWSCITGHVEVVKSLLIAGANCFNINNSGQDPISLLSGDCVGEYEIKQIKLIFKLADILYKELDQKGTSLSIKNNFRDLLELLTSKLSSPKIFDRISEAVDNPGAFNRLLMISKQIKTFDFLPFYSLSKSHNKILKCSVGSQNNIVNQFALLSLKNLNFPER